MDNLILTDYIFLFIVGVSTLFGFARGFLRELFTILNMVLAIGATYLLFPTAVTFVSSHLKDELWIKGVAAVGSFVFCWVIIAIVNSFVLDALKFMRGGFVDRIMGIALGIARGALIVIGVYMGVTITVNAQNDDSELPAWMREAKSLNYIKVQSQYVLALMPENFREFYKNQNASLSDSFGETVEEGVGSFKAPNLKEMGFDQIEMKNFQELLSNVDDSLKIEDVDSFSPNTIKIIGEQALEDYKLGNIKGDAKALSEDQLKSIKEQLESIKVKDAY